jgi:hypothetical protein
LNIFRRGFWGWLRLFTLRTLWLAGGRRLPLAPSGGDHTTHWPDEAESFLRTTLATGEPANFSFLADGLPNDFYTDGLSLFGHESRKAGDTLQDGGWEAVPNIAPESGTGGPHTFSVPVSEAKMFFQVRVSVP